MTQYDPLYDDDGGNLFQGGWVPTPRCIWSDPRFRSDLDPAIYLYLVARAAHRPGFVYRTPKGAVALQIGQAVVTHRGLAERWRGMVSRGVINRVLDRLRRTGLIETELANPASAQSATVVTIVRYNDYLRLACDSAEGGPGQARDRSADDIPEAAHAARESKLHPVEDNLASARQLLFRDGRSSSGTSLAGRISERESCSGGC